MENFFYGLGAGIILVLGIVIFITARKRNDNGADIVRVDPTLQREVERLEREGDSFKQQRADNDKERVSISTERERLSTERSRLDRENELLLELNKRAKTESKD